MTELTDSERIEWLDELTKKSLSGVSLEYVKGHGYRFMSRHKLDDFRPTLRQAIDDGIRLRSDIERR